MTTSQRDRLAQLARNSQPVTVAALVAQWQCSVETARTTLALCGYMPIGGQWHHPDHVPESSTPLISNPNEGATPHITGISRREHYHFSQAPDGTGTITLKPGDTPAILPLPLPATRHPSPLPRPYREPSRRLPAWISVDPIDLLADLEATKVTRTWLLANVEPALWPHPHRTPCPACPLLQPCSSLSRHRQATICEAVIAQRRIDHANLPGTSDVYRTPARFGPAGSQDLRDIHPAQNAALAAG